ncbi:MAG: aconitate hydratase AcnA [Chromatiales bacterium]|nr:aconitate hydratase AcnA [Chromatiales bacterium]
MNSFDTKTILEIGSESYTIFDISRIEQARSLPFCLKILLENLLRHEDGQTVCKDDIQALVDRKSGNKEIAYRPARVLMQDFTGVPAVVDLAAMRSAIDRFGLNPDEINPLQPTDLVIDHSIQVDKFGNDKALDLNTRIEFQRNRERYNFLKWGQKAFSNFKVVPPGSGIVHQVNLEYLARVIFIDEQHGMKIAYPDTLVGTDSHTTMINGIGVLGWGVGGIEAEASMLGQPISMLVPKVVGFKLSGKLPEGSTATDLVLTVVEMLRKLGVVGKFVEFYGDGLNELSLGDRATIANMAPEYGATCGIFPIDRETIDYLSLSGRSDNEIAVIETYAKQCGLWRNDENQLQYDQTIELALDEVVPSLAGPKRPQDRIPLNLAQEKCRDALSKIKPAPTQAEIEIDGEPVTLSDGFVAIAAITSCTNTSNPSVMLAAGLLAKKALERGLRVKPWVKTSLAPGSQVVTDYLQNAKLMDALQKLNFYIVGYGCTTCIGNSGPLSETIATAIKKHKLIASAVLSGNRNFEGRIHSQVQLNYLASPPLVIAYALAGTMNIDLYKEPLANDQQGKPVFLKDIWPSRQELNALLKQALSAEQFHKIYAEIYKGTEDWKKLDAPADILYDWSDSTYIAHPPYFENFSLEAQKPEPIKNARVLAILGDSVTTDHISPAGSIAPNSPAGLYLQAQGVLVNDFNSYGSRRGNHEVMVRGTFANIRLRNKLVPDVEGGYTLHFPSKEQMTIYDAAMRYIQESVATIVIAGKEYGSGSSRDWAAKGPRLQGVRAVIAESFERIHRTNLIGMGILPLQFLEGDSVQTLGLNGSELYTIDITEDGFAEVHITDENNQRRDFKVKIRIDTPQEQDYYDNGGILHYVLRQLAA